MRWSLGYELLFADFFPHCQDYAELLPGIYVRVRIEDAIDIEAIAVSAQGVQHTMASGNAVLSSMMPGGPRGEYPQLRVDRQGLRSPARRLINLSWDDANLLTE